MYPKNDHSRGTKFSLKFFRVVWEQDDVAPQLVLRVNRQLPKATQRNRVKRIVREFFRRHESDLKKGRWVFIAKRSAEEAANQELFLDLEKTLAKVDH